MNEQNSTSKEWLERFEKDREWRQTPIGAAFDKFEITTQRYWQDSNDCINHASVKQLKELDETLRKARAEFLLLLRGW